MLLWHGEEWFTAQQSRADVSSDGVELNGWCAQQDAQDVCRSRQALAVFFGGGHPAFFCLSRAEAEGLRGEEGDVYFLLISGLEDVGEREREVERGRYREGEIERGRQRGAGRGSARVCRTVRVTTVIKVRNRGTSARRHPTKWRGEKLEKRRGVVGGRCQRG